MHRTSVQAGNGAVARTCRVIPRHRVVGRSHTVFSEETLLQMYTTPGLAVISAILLRRAKEAGPAPPSTPWLSGTGRPAWLQVRLYLFRISGSFGLAVAPVSQAAALIAEASSECVTQMSATMGWPRRSARWSPRSGSRWGHVGSLWAAAGNRVACGEAGVVELGGRRGVGVKSMPWRHIAYIGSCRITA